MDRTGVGTLCLWLCAATCLTHGQHYVNIAREKTYDQSSTFPSQGPSSNGANGNTDVIKRLVPSVITVDGKTCASISSDSSNTREKTVTCPSIMYGQSVRITKQSEGQAEEDRYLNFCEMQIWGCAEGWYGLQCSTACSKGCQNTACDRTTGHCSPCNAGYEGDMCSECQDGYYSMSDTCLRCSENCQAQSCDKQTGNCYGCVDGRYGGTCTMYCTVKTAQCLKCDQYSGVCTECQDGYYKTSSDTCDPCSVGCDSRGCDKQTGKCYECKDGYYNSSGTCRQCSANCKAQSCNKQTGKCNDCVDGHHGDMCTLHCQPAQCLRCGQDTGVCTDCTLNSNRQAPDCTECQDGYYNSSGTCRQCSANCQAQSCDKKTGKCNGCVDGRHGRTCTSLCQTAKCQRCAQDTGVCTHCAAHSNLQPPDCTDCQDGYYKRSDNTGCDACRGTCQSGTVCDKIIGFCLLCPPGKQGYFCDQALQDDDDADDDDTIVITGPVIAVLVAIIIALIIGIFVMRRRRSQAARSRSSAETGATSPTAVPADRGQMAAVFQGGPHHEGHYENVGDIPMSTKHVHPGPPADADTDADTTSHVTAADNPYDLPSVQYTNTEEVHVYDPWRVSRADQPGDVRDRPAHSTQKGKRSDDKK